MRWGAALLAVAWCSAALAQTTTSTTRPIRIEVKADYNQVKGPLDRSFEFCVGAGRANEGLRAAWQRDLAIAAHECGFRNIRMHGILHDDMGVYREDKEKRPVYNFQYVDELHDFLLSIGVRPYVELSFMPALLASGEKTVFWWKANVTPPSDPEKWRELIRRFVQHAEHRYGREEVKRWHFEVWNEPNHPAFFSHGLNEYLALYKVTAEAVKSVCAEYRVGGPATAGVGWINETLEFCQREKVPLDFISTHHYGVAGWGLRPGDRELMASDKLLKTAIGGVYSKVKASSRPELPIHFTEWSRSPSDKDPFHDYYLSAAYILDKLKTAEGLQQGMSYWTFTDTFEEHGPPPTAFYGGFGLMNMHGLKKASYFAYAFLHQLGDEELKQDCPTAWVCRSGRGVQAIVWDYAKRDAPFRGEMAPQREGSARVSIANLPEGEYELSIRRVGYRANDVYSDYLYLGSPAWLSREQVRELGARNSAAPERVEMVRHEGGAFERDLAMRENDVVLLTLNRRGATTQP